MEYTKGQELRRGKKRDRSESVPILEKLKRKTEMSTNNLIHRRVMVCVARTGFRSNS